MRVMLDTNILVSMIFFPSNITREVARMLCEKHRIVICDYVIEELRLVVERKFPNLISALEDFFSTLPFDLVVVPRRPPIETPAIRDAKDYPIIATAINENVDILITGDKDFLVLDIKRPDIMTMKEFVETY